MPYSFLSQIKEASLSLDKGVKPQIFNLPELLSSWRSYLISIDAPQHVLESIEPTDTRFVLTGQQVGFLCSPILSLYKALTAECLANEISSKITTPVIPVFWLQTEDHDLNEIYNALIFNDAQEIFKLSLATLKDNRIPVGDLKPADLFNIEALSSVNLPEDILALIRDSLKQESLGSAYAYLFYKLFPETKVVLFDPRLLNLTNYTSDIYAECIDNPEIIHSLLRAQALELTKENIPVPISVDKDRSLFFLANDKGERFRLKYKENTYSAIELKNILQSNPERFSSSALLRPILQDALFSSIAYIGGKSELEYHKQITPLYKYLKLTQPHLIERAQGLILDEKFLKWLPDSMHQIDSFLVDTASLKSSLKARHGLSNKIESLKANSQEKLTILVAQLTESSKDLDQSLLKPLSKTINTISEALNKYLSKVEEQELRENSILSERIERITKITHPDKNLQERVISAISVHTLLGENAYQIVKNSIAESIKNNITLNSYETT